MQPLVRLLPVSALLLTATVNLAFGACDTTTAVRIMPLGNSITEGASGWATYRCWLWKELSDSGFCFNLVMR
jgi:hypothetical protein